LVHKHKPRQRNTNIIIARHVSKISDPPPQKSSHSTQNHDPFLSINRQTASLKCAKNQGLLAPSPVILPIGCAGRDLRDMRSHTGENAISQTHHYNIAFCHRVHLAGSEPTRSALALSRRVATISLGCCCSRTPHSLLSNRVAPPLAGVLATLDKRDLQDENQNHRWPCICT